MESLVASAYDLTPAHPGADVHGGLGGLSHPTFFKINGYLKVSFYFWIKEWRREEEKKDESLVDFLTRRLDSPRAHQSFHYGADEASAPRISSTPNARGKVNTCGA